MNFNTNYLVLLCVAISKLAENIAHASLAPEEKIVGGEVTSVGRYPYIAGLLVEGFNFYGGSLIASEWVLSAAHCAPDDESPFKYQVDIGRHDRTNSTETYEMIDFEYFVIHPNYNPFSLENDVLMIKLAKPSKYPVAKLNTAYISQLTNSSIAF